MYFKIYGLYFLGDALCFSTLQKHGKSCPLPSLYQRLHFISFWSFIDTQSLLYGSKTSIRTVFKTNCILFKCSSTENYAYIYYICNSILQGKHFYMSTAILKYPAGNIFSVKSALTRLGVDSIVTDDVQLLSKADHIIIPGQGEAAVTMDYLCKTGMNNVIRSFKQPVLGICIGMQLMCDYSEEGGGVKCLGIFPEVKVTRFLPKNNEKIPHMGWNSISNINSALFKGIDEESYVYFVHSYYVPCNKFTTSQCNYTVNFSASIEHDNFMAVQFHPEKSGKTGELILKNFLEL